jgi:hypothetical protein
MKQILCVYKISDKLSGTVHISVVSYRSTNALSTRDEQMAH